MKETLPRVSKSSGNGKFGWHGWVLGAVILLALVPVLSFYPALTRKLPDIVRTKGVLALRIARETQGRNSAASRSTAASIRKLSKRPSRLPPPDVALQRCLAALNDEEEDRKSSGGLSTSDAEFLGLGNSTSATNLLFTESRREVLLGECKCPLKVPHPDPEWSFDCAEWDYKILSELAPWWGLNISHAMLDFTSAFKTADAWQPPTYHFSVKEGKAYWNINPGVTDTAFHEAFLSMIDTAAKTVEMPDVEFLATTWDWQSVQRQEPAPIFSTSKDHGRLDVVLPHPYTWSAVKEDFDLEWTGGCKDKPWEDRDPRVTTRLGCMGPKRGFQPLLYHTYLRARATDLTHQYPDLLNVGLVQVCALDSLTTDDMQRRAGPQALPSALPWLDLEQKACEYQSLLLLDGNTISGRSSRYFNSGSTIFKPDSIFSEWYFHLLRPWVHYVPVREFLEDLPEVAAYMRENQELGKCIAENGKKFAKRYLNNWTASCYMWRLLSAWSSQQPEGSRRLDGMLETDDWWGVKERGGVHTADSPVHPVIKQQWENHMYALGLKKGKVEGEDQTAAVAEAERAEDALERLDREAGR
jgi:Glycosyl transferase family 90